MMQQKNGFNLIEIAIVLLILSLLLTQLLNPISAQIDYLRYKETEKTLENIKIALLGFTAIYGRLPFPASNPETGLQDANFHKKEAYLPWADLGIGRQDAWGNPFRYRAEDEYTEIPLDYDRIFGKLGHGTGSSLRVKDKKNHYLTKEQQDSRVAAIIFSYGKNGIPETENAYLNKTFIYDVYIENEFDDILTWLSRNTLVNYLPLP
jgi:prepilin-type N-terminal cleavage/methylation domain-containing protein